MVIYVVLYDTGYDFFELRGVFSSLEKAEEFVSTRKSTLGYNTSEHYVIEETMLDKEF